MKIAFFVTDITTLGGVERTTLLLANEFIRFGHDVKIVSLFKKNETIKFPLGLISDIQYVIPKGYLLKEDSSNRLASFFSLFLLLTKFRNKTKEIDSNTLCIAQCFLPSVFLWLYGKSRRTIVCEHFKYELYNKLVCNIRDKIYSNFLQIITLTKEDYDKYLKVLSNVRIIPNMSPYLVSKSADMNKKRIISVGRLTYQKGYDYLIKAICKCKNQISGWSIHIYGEGELEKELKLLAKLNNVDDILFFEGYSNNIEKELMNSSIFVLSSRFEGLPMVLLEAMSKGLAIVSFDCPEGPRALLENNAGFLVEKENIDALAQALVTMTQSNELRQEYSKKAQLAIENFSPQKIVELWHNLFSDLKIK